MKSSGSIIQLTLESLMGQTGPLHLPRVFPMRRDASGKWICPNGRVKTNRANLCSPDLSGLVIPFGSLFDIHLERCCPLLASPTPGSFARVYRHFSPENDSIRIAAEIKRIYLLFHQIILRCDRDDFFSPAYPGNSDLPGISADGSFLHALFSLTALLILLEQQYTPYTVGLVWKSYLDCLTHVVFFRDDIGCPLYRPPANAPVFSHFRCRVEHPLFKIHPDGIELTRERNPAIDGRSRSFEYMVRYRQNLYLVPDEALPDQPVVLVTDADRWSTTCCPLVNFHHFPVCPE